MKQIKIPTEHVTIEYNGDKVFERVIELLAEDETENRDIYLETIQSLVDQLKQSRRNCTQLCDIATRMHACYISLQQRASPLYIFFAAMIGAGVAKAVGL